VHVAAWIEAGTRELAAPSVKQRLAALRHLFDWLVNGQVVPVNPAHTVRGPRHVVTTGQTPVLDPAEARALLDSRASVIIGCHPLLRVPRDELLRDAGEVALAYHDERVRGVKAQRIQCDEIWSFVAVKQKNRAASKRASGSRANSLKLINYLNDSSAGKNQHRVRNGAHAKASLSPVLRDLSGNNP
jgi:hypothetical protein